MPVRIRSGPHTHPPRVGGAIGAVLQRRFRFPGVAQWQSTPFGAEGSRYRNSPLGHFTQIVLKNKCCKPNLYSILLKGRILMRVKGWSNTQKVKRKCQYCGKELPCPNHKSHEASCSERPENINYCPVCSKRTKKGSITCGYSCANIYFKHGVCSEEYREEHKSKKYNIICFKYHKKKCVVCPEDKIVAAHHFDGNRLNDDWKNLVPMCPTHHSYMHSRWRYLIEEKVIDYHQRVSQRI